MTRLAPAVLVIFATSGVIAEETRQMDAHEHGVGQLNIAIEGDRIAMELHAPGADIVGFEYAAESAEDRAKVDAAVATLARPLDLFTLPAAAGCSVVQASASLESEDPHEEHGHEDEHRHEDHAEHKEDGHDHEEHAEDSTKEEDHAAHEEDHDHAEEASHTEFHAEYQLNCADPAQATLIRFAYFEAFPNALELEVQVISERGASAFEVERSQPTLDLRDMF